MADNKVVAGAVQLRASHADRQRVVDLLDSALGEGRLDAAEHDARVGQARAARQPAELAGLLADLPDKPGVWAWTDRLRVRAADRRSATAWLGDAFTEGVLTAEEHERRLAEAAEAVTYRELKQVLDGIAGPPTAARERLLVTEADRAGVTARLSRELAAGRIGPADHAELETAVAAATRYADLDEASAALDAHTRSDPRAEVLRRLADAYADGQILVTEYEHRTRTAREAERNADLRGLLDGLIEGADSATPEWIVGRPKSELRRRRLSDAERKQAARALERALQEGRLELDEYDQRVRGAYAAQVAADLRPLLVDLVAPRARAQSPDAPAAAAVARRPGRLVAVLAALAVLVAGTVAVVVWRSGEPGEPGVPGADRRNLAVQWQAGPDRPAGIRAAGNWVEGATLIRARTDQLTAYDVTAGRVGWTLPMPDRNYLCTMSRGTEQGIGLIGFGPSDRGLTCSTVAAVDLATGRLLWQRTRKISTRFTPLDPVDDEVGIAAGTAVLKEAAGFVAVGLRDNKVKWRVPAPAKCAGYSVTAAGDDAVLISACEDATAQLVMADAASGRIRFRAGLRLHEDDALRATVDNVKTTVVLATTPLVVRTTEDGSRTHDALVSFDGQGQRRATIPLSQDDLDIAPEQLPGTYSGHIGFPARRPRALAVVGDTLVAPVRPAGGSEEDRVAAFSLADGRRLWEVPLPEDVVAAESAEGRFDLMTFDGTIHSLSPADGRTVSAIEVDGLPGYLPAADLRLVAGRYVISNENGSAEFPPVLVIG